MMSDERGKSYEGGAPDRAGAPQEATAGAGEKRVALVIGNAGYRYGGKLANPHRDAEAIAASFSALGFHQVVTHTDLELRTLTRALTDFRLVAEAADTAVVYFAGHGIEVDGLNRLIPVDAELDHVIRVPDETVPLNRVQQAVQGARGLRVVILDACRDNPFVERMRGLSRGRDAGPWSRLPLELEPTRSIGQGLAAPKGISNMLVAYAADAGQKAKDGPVDGNSPFASAFVEALKAEPHLDVRFLFGRVRDEVFRSTGGFQEPAIYGQLGGGTYALCPAPLSTVIEQGQGPSAPPASDLAFWQAEWTQISSCEDASELEHFASHAPPYFSGKARTRIAQIQAAAARVEQEARQRAEVEARAKADEEARQREAANWAWAEQENNIEAYERFLSAWPQGRFSDEARIRLGALKAPPPPPKPSVSVTGVFFTSPTATVNQAPLRERSFEVVVGDGKNDRTVRLTPGATAPKDAPFAPELVLVPPGKFWMGSKDGQGDNDERPRHEVTIGYPLLVGKYPVTFEEWDAYVAKASSGGFLGFGGSKPHKPDDQGWGRGRRPVINVSWHDAQAYATWLSKTTGKTYRLLSEAEWEYACRAGTETAYSFDDESKIGDYAWYSANSGSKTQPVGDKKPNGFGLHDMHGNVWEWCEDVLTGSYQGAPVDGSARSSADRSVSRVLRGGSWSYDPRVLRSANRSRSHPVGRYNAQGFRLARTLNHTP